MIDYQRFDVENNEKQIIVDVTLRERDRQIRKQICTTEDIMKELKKRSVDVGECTSSPDLVSNRNHNRISGQWVFNLPRPKKQVIPKKAIKSVKTTKK